MSPLISIITVNFNTLEDTIDLLRSIVNCRFSNYEIIVVDNASQIDPRSIILNKFPEVQVLRNDRNLGFAGANNLGIAKSKGKYLFFLNNDTIVADNFFEPIINYMEENQQVGMLCPKVLYPDGKTIQYAGARKINLFTGRGKRLGLFEQDRGQYAFIKETDLGHGGAMVVPHNIIKEVGLMPEIYFLYYEEHDWAEKMKRLSYSIVYFGHASILHKESASIGKISPLKMFYQSRNRILFLKRNSKGIKRVIGILFILLVSLPRNTIRMIFNNQHKLIRQMYRGVFWHINHNLTYDSKN